MVRPIPLGGRAAIGGLDVISSPGSCVASPRGYTSGGPPEQLCSSGIPLLLGAWSLILIHVADIGSITDPPAGACAPAGPACYPTAPAASLPVSPCKYVLQYCSDMPQCKLQKGDRERHAGCDCTSCLLQVSDWAVPGQICDTSVASQPHQVCLVPSCCKPGQIT